MNYRFAKVCSYYREFLDQYYREYPYIKDASCMDQDVHLMDQGYGYSNYFSEHMDRIGNCSIDIIHNAKPLQSAWMKERGLKGDPVIEQLKYFRPDVVMFQDSVNFSTAFFKSLRKQVPSIKLLIGTHGSPVSDQAMEVYRNFDLVLCHSPLFVQRIKAMGLKAYLFYHSIEESLCETPTAKPVHDVVFLGSFMNSANFHENRIEFFDKIKQAGIDIKIFAPPITEKLYFLKYLVFQFTQALKFLGLGNLAMRLPVIKKFALMDSLKKPFNHSYGDSVFGKKMLQRLTTGKIGINIHAGIAGDYACNVRMFEITGMGGCLVTDEKENIGDLFVSGREIVTYHDVHDCIRKIRVLLKHPDIMQNIAKAGQARTLKDYTVKSRVDLLDKIITKNL